MKENTWFRQNQNLLLWMANTDYGRDLLCVPKQYGKITRITKCSLTSVEDRQNRVIKQTDFRIGAKWGNIIRTRYDDFIKYAGYYERDWGRLLRSFISFPVVFYPGLTTDTFYPDPDPETNTTDGWTRTQEADGTTWANINSQAGTASGDTGANNQQFSEVNSGAVSGNWFQNYRGIYMFNTGPTIPAGDTISSATFSLFGDAKQDQLATVLTMVRYTGSATTGLVSSDYNLANWNMVAQSGTTFTLTAFSITAYNDFPLNSTGIGNISKGSGITKFGTTNTADRDNSSPTWAANKRDYFAGKMADAAGTANDPKLVVVHVSAANAGLLMLGT